MRRSDRGAVDPFIVMDVMERARAAEAAGASVIHMEVGQPGTPAPAAARRAVAEALEAGPLGYTVALGLPALRARIARLYADWYGVDLDPGRVIVTSGSSVGFVLAFTALFDARARVGLGLPGYPSYRQILRALSLDPVGIETAAPDYRIDPARIGPDLAGLIVASPNNPTGAMLDRAALEATVAACAAADVALVSDEIYHGLHHDARAVSALEVTDDVVVINSFSKYFSMTGWRVGWMVVPEELVAPVQRLAQNLYISAPELSQVAAREALSETEELEAVRETYAANRTILVEALPRLGFADLFPADGAFYVYACCEELADDSMDLAERLLELGVAATPGQDFDARDGHRWMRFSYAGSRATLKTAVERMARLR